VNLAAGANCRMCHRSPAGGVLRHTTGFSEPAERRLEGVRWPAPDLTVDNPQTLIRIGPNDLVAGYPSRGMRMAAESSGWPRWRMRPAASSSRKSQCASAISPEVAG
jgi:hypothetical protein